MIEVIKGYVDIWIPAIMQVYNFKIELVQGKLYKIGDLTIAFLVLCLCIYIVLEVAGIKKGDDD